MKWLAWITYGSIHGHRTFDTWMNNPGAYFTKLHAVADHRVGGYQEHGHGLPGRALCGVSIPHSDPDHVIAWEREADPVHYLEDRCQRCEKAIPRRVDRGLELLERLDLTVRGDIDDARKASPTTYYGIGWPPDRAAGIYGAWIGPTFTRENDALIWLAEHEAHVRAYFGHTQIAPRLGDFDWLPMGTQVKVHREGRNRVETLITEEEDRWITAAPSGDPDDPEPQYGPLAKDTKIVGTDLPSPEDYFRMWERRRKAQVKRALNRNEGEDDA